MRRISNDAATLVRAFRAQAGRQPAGVWAAPGRVNLIGEHTDYNDGYVMPFALAQRVVIAAAPRQDGIWSVTSLNKYSTEVFRAADLHPGMTGWQAYVAGVVWALLGGRTSDRRSRSPAFIRRAGGAGLSSSAALECAVLPAPSDINDLHIA